MFQCYYIVTTVKDENGVLEDVRCPNKQDTYFCSKEHEEGWQKKQYGVDAVVKSVKSTEEIQKGILRMKKFVREKTIEGR